MNYLNDVFFAFAVMEKHRTIHVMERNLQKTSSSLYATYYTYLFCPTRVADVARFLTDHGGFGVPSGQR